MAIWILICFCSAGLLLQKATTKVQLLCHLPIHVIIIIVVLAEKALQAAITLPDSTECRAALMHSLAMCDANEVRTQVEVEIILNT